MIRHLHLDLDALRAYSRRGNIHSDAELARRHGLPDAVAQGMQVAGPAYGLLLDAWGEAFLRRGELELRFVGMVLAGQTVEARVELAEAGGRGGAPTEASITVTEGDRTVVVGTARAGNGAEPRPSV